ncbi:MAG: hypothetical protein DMD82_02215 [Candidatus Rokuibacteriota bacterium]|nr:MAG: hypothetical protein DMD82_02215 [Candidatus Rokubacteria bacterium]
MLIRVSEIPAEGLSIQGVDVLPEPYHDSSWRLLRLSLFVEKDDADVFVRGQVEASVPQVCGRCLERFPLRVELPIDARFAPKRVPGKEDVELASDDLEIDFYADDMLNLAQVVETETTLELPMKPLCREGCRGLCPVCGGNRNLVECACAVKPSDLRFAVLKDLAARLPSK